MPDRSPEALKKKLLDDPNTPKLAETLGLSLEDYVQLVLHYATSGEQPQFFVVSDENLRKLGYEPPDPKAMSAYLNQAVATIYAQEGTAYTPERKGPVSLGDIPAQNAPPADPELKKKVDAEVLAKRGGQK